MLAITGSVMGSGAIFKDTKIESIFRLDKGAFEGLFKTLINVNGTLGPELIGSFPNFPLGATALDVESQDVYKEMRRVIDQWIAARKSGRNGVLMFVGGNGLLNVAEALLRNLQPALLLITLGDQGLLLCQRGQKPFHIPTLAREVFDVSGAGDTVIASFTLAIAAGASPLEGAIFSNHAAGVVVGKIGTATVSSEELLASFKREL